MTTKEIIYKNAAISYRVSGAGNALMLLHGFGEDGRVWDSLAAELGKNYLVIIPDIPGSGKSTMLTDEFAGLEDFADCMHLLLTKEDIKQCCLVGHSMGGYIGLAFAALYPHLLSGLGLFHSSAFADDDEKKQTRKKAIDFIKEKGSSPFLKTSTPTLFAAPEKHEVVINNLIERGGQFLPAALIQYYEAMISRPDRTGVLASAEVPVLMIIGQHDKAIPVEQGLQQSHLSGETHLTVLRDSGHMGMFEEPEKSLNTLADFLHSVYV